MTITLDNAGAEALAEQLAGESVQYEGFLTHREASFLSNLAISTPGEGVILEIGSYRGKSTIILAKAELASRGRSTLVAIDPVIDMQGRADAAGLQVLKRNLDAAGVGEIVEFHQAYSQDLAPDWTRAVRLLWIDGDHSLEGALRDITLYSPFLETNGVIAMHDVMHCAEVTRAFTDRVLLADEYGPAGIVGSIGWAQRRAPGTEDSWAGHRKRLAQTLERYTQSAGRRDSMLGKWRAKFHRARVPHGSISVRAFQKEIGVARV